MPAARVAFVSVLKFRLLFPRERNSPMTRSSMPALGPVYSSVTQPYAAAQMARLAVSRSHVTSGHDRLRIEQFIEQSMERA